MIRPLDARSALWHTFGTPEGTLKRINWNAVTTTAALLFLAWFGYEWLRAEDAVGHRYQGAPDGGIYGHP